MGGTGGLPRNVCILLSIGILWGGPSRASHMCIYTNRERERERERERDVARD